MNAHNLISNLIKNIGYFILLFIFSVIVAGIAKKFAIPLTLGGIILEIILFIGSVWIGYKNTKDANEPKFQNSFILHLIITVLSGVFVFFTDKDPLWKQAISGLLFLVSIEVGSFIYYLKHRKSNVDL